MINFDFEQDCCGCTACANSCAHGAITMQRNDEGFLMPVVNKNKCVDCGLCDKACPHLNTLTDRSQFSLESFKDRKAYLYFSNKSERKGSASGGFVFDAYRKCLSEHGYVSGCVWNDNMEANHIVTSNSEDLSALQSSRYVQSNLNDTYKTVRKLLREGNKVVFCGTPCQTAGLDTYLGKADCSNLISICLICHGIASPGVWQKWVSIMEEKYDGRLVNVNMRDKSYKGYSTSYSKYTFIKNSGHASHGANVDNNSTTYLANKTRNVGMPTYLADPYIFLFTDDLYLRHSCNHCQYKADQNRADIIVGDYYASTPEAGNDGCSCLIAMTSKGDEFIHTLDGTIIDSDYHTVGSVNSMLWKSVDEHPRRKEFFERYKKKEAPDEHLFTDFLPFRFKVKKILNQLGLFNVIRSIIKK